MAMGHPAQESQVGPPLPRKGDQADRRMVAAHQVLVGSKMKPCWAVLKVNQTTMAKHLVAHPAIRAKRILPRAKPIRRPVEVKETRMSLGPSKSPTRMPSA